MSGPPTYKPARPVLEFKELSVGGGWAWFLKRPVGSGHLILATSIGNGYLATAEEAEKSYRRFLRDAQGVTA